MNIKSYMSVADLFSIGNASFGFLSIVMIINGDLVLAAKFMLISVIFDALDGWVARKVKRLDEYGFGKNIDSLCDVISFGVAPGIFLYSATLTFSIPYINILVSLLIVICGILRLSRFNIITSSIKSSKEFVGLPIPATAMIISSFYLSGMFHVDLSLVIMTAVSLLMISTITYPKISDIKIMVIGGVLLLATLIPQSILASIYYIPGKTLFVASILYLLIIPFIRLYSKKI
ncbi:MAG: archaetidylserine synthase [Methanobacteriaceae archaeon]|nr:archaetidylserine synthase [Methanobacteriaceae archaeon]